MKASNIGGLKTVQDAHETMGKSFGLSREIAKKINTPLLHGSTIKTIAKVLTDKTGVKITEIEVSEKVFKAYGPEAVNITAIADWGTIVYDSRNTSLMFTAIDGWKCQSVAYSPSVKLEVYGLDMTSDKGWSVTTVHRDMPLLLSAKGEAVYEDSKTRGLYANITHMIDGWSLRMVVNELDGAILLKHDKFYTHPNDMHQVRATYKKAAIIEQSTNMYENAMKEVVEKHVGSMRVPLPELIDGKGTREMVEASDSFLMP